MWQWERADWEGRVERRKLEQSGQIQQMIQQGAEQLHAQMMQQQAQVPEEGPGPQQPNPMNPQGTQGMVEGQMFNPQQQGMPPAMATPEGATFEGATGRTRGGEEIAGLA
jgi:hypothetical protein